MCSPFIVGYVKYMLFNMSDCVSNGVQFSWIGCTLIFFIDCLLVLRITIIYFIVYLVHTLTVWPFVYMFYVFVLPNILFSTSALNYPRRIPAAVCFLYVCAPYLNHFCLISTQTNFCCLLVCFIFTAINRLLKKTLR